MIERPDKMLVEAFLAGDKRAFDVLVARHEDYLRKFLASRIWRQSDIDDELQHVFIRASAKLKSLRTPPLFRAWLLRIAASVAADWQRATQKAKTQNETDHGSPLAAVAEPSINPRAFFLEVVSPLPDRYRRAVTMFYLEGMTVDEIAKKEGITVAAANKRRLRGYTLLRSALQKGLR